MKKLLVVLSALLLSSCITADDFGAYWNAGYADPNLSGGWAKISEATSMSDNDKKCTFTEKDKAYDILCTDSKKPSGPAKTLDIGAYHFLMVRNEGKAGGNLLRYDVSGSMLTIYDLNGAAADPYIKANFPDIKNVEIKHFSDASNSAYMEIKTLDDGVYRLLGGLPYDDKYWYVVARMQKSSD